ncbi:MAG: 3-hydroxyacyl-[acyl-carrier-protein] dehydratase, partial [Candidatus Hydrogenedentes bacterium]|nr:3-hydroxyacyl-[acyl-carrier-protein] dehydratase [Candidatus Hydrogenedentota bacterium]
LVIEVMAQVSSLLTFGDNGKPPGKFAFLMGIEQAQFRRTVGPGDQIVVEAEMLHVCEDSCKVKAVAKIDGIPAAEATMTFGLMDVSQ